MAKLNKKGRNPNGGPLDCWLDSLGYYRKNVAYDETCLFRAVSEQLFSCQLFHEKVRSDCIEFAKSNSREFPHIETNKELWLEHLDKLSKHMIICGDVEISIISRKYKKNILLFNEHDLSTTNITYNDSDETLYLCFMGEDHYDVVYKKEFISNAGFCQSIIYGIAYESVFHMTQVSEIVDHMLNEKPSNLQMTDDLIHRMKVAEEFGVFTNTNNQVIDSTHIVPKHEQASSTKNSLGNWIDFNLTLPCISANKTSDDTSSAKHWVESKVQTQRLQLQLGLTTPTNQKAIPLKQLVKTKELAIQIPSTSTSCSKRIMVNEDLQNDVQTNMVRAGGCWLYTGSSQKCASNGPSGDGSPGYDVVLPLTDFEMLICGKIAPFPYKVAKALDPNIYRNIEYDTWSEMRKEMRLCNWYYGDNNFKEGTCCRIKFDGNTYPCYIQNINGDTCDIFLTQSAERKTVNMKDLLPEEDAKPWPIPYRFTKNSQSLNAAPFSNVSESHKRSRRRSRDKKRTSSNGSSNAGQDEHATVLQNPYEGCPLVQQHSQLTQQTQLKPSRQLPLPLSIIDTSMPPPTIQPPTPPAASAQSSVQLLQPVDAAVPSSHDYQLQQQQQVNCQTADSDASSMVVWDTSYWENAMPPATPDTAQVAHWVPVPMATNVGGPWLEQQPGYQQEAPVSGDMLPSPGVVPMFPYDSNYYYNNTDTSYTNVWTEYPTVVPVTTQDGNVEHISYMIATSAPTYVHPMSPQLIDPSQFRSHTPTPNPPHYPCTPPGTPILYAPPPIIPPLSPYQDAPAPYVHPLFLPLPSINQQQQPPPPGSQLSPLTTSGPLTPHTPTTLHNHTTATLYHSAPSATVGDLQGVVPFIQAIPTPTYVYPTTPTWYPPGINAHGFIFPTVALQPGTGNGATSGGATATV